MSHFDELLEYLEQKALEGDKFSQMKLDEWELIKNIQNGHESNNTNPQR